MTNYTRSAIKDAFVALLDEQPGGRITVKDVVLKCGINRNTFYYYFQDLADLAEAVVRENFERLVAGRLSLRSVGDCVYALVISALDHRETILRLYRGTERERFELSQWRVCEAVAEQYLATVLEGRTISPEDRMCLVSYIRSLLFGLVMDALREGLKPELRTRFRRIAALKAGQVEEVLNRSASEN